MFAGNDAFTIDEDSVTVSLDVLANDTMGGVVITSGTIAITQGPGLRTAVVNTTTGAIDYTPNLNANGNDLLTYTVTVNGQTSPPAFVSITINPVNDFLMGLLPLEIIRQVQESLPW